MKRFFLILILVFSFSFSLFGSNLNDFTTVSDFLDFPISLLGFFGFAKIIGCQTGWKGKVGNEIFAMWKGIQVVKTMFSPANPQTAGQTANRGCMSTLVQTFKPLATYWIRPLWNPFANGSQSGWGNFVSRNKLSMGSTFDISDAFLSYGTLECIADLAGVYTTGDGTLAVTFDGTIFGNGSAGDHCSLAVFDAASGTVVYFKHEVDIRSDDKVDTIIPSGLTATDLTVFLTMADADPLTVDVTSVSTSQSVVCSAV